MTSRVLTRVRTPRRAILLVLAVTDVLFGAALWGAAHYPETVYWWPAETGEVVGIPLPVCAIIWILVGVGLATAMFTSSDIPHYALAVLVKSWWAAGAIYWYFTGTVSPGAWGIAVAYVGFAAVILLCAAWPAVPVPLERPE